MEYAPHRQLKD